MIVWNKIKKCESIMIILALMVVILNLKNEVDGNITLALMCIETFYVPQIQVCL